MLSKLPEQVVIPAVPGTPAVPYLPARTVCVPASTTGHYVQVCSTVRMRLVPNTVIQYPPGTQSYSFVTVGNVDYIDFFVCRSEWVEIVDPSGPVCSHYPEQVAVPEVPPTPQRVMLFNSFEWNAGANSVASLTGDVVERDTMNAVVGVVWGLASERPDSSNYATIEHGLYFHVNGGGQPRVSVMESGRIMDSERAYAPGDEFEVRRNGSRVTYWHAGFQFYRSTVPSTGEVFVGSAMYATGDEIL